MNELEKRLLMEKLLSSDTCDADAVALLYAVRHDEDFDIIKEAVKPINGKSVEMEEMGVIGNVWVRTQYYKDKNIPHNGHKHNHDHLSLLAKGSLMVHVDGYKPVRYDAPAFFKVAANHEHNLIPLEDETIAYCIFALRDDNGEVVHEIDDATKHYENFV